MGFKANFQAWAKGVASAPQGSGVLDRLGSGGMALAKKRWSGDDEADDENNADEERRYADYPDTQEGAVKNKLRQMYSTWA